MSAVYVKCEGDVSVSMADPSALQCSTGFVQVDEPTFTLITYEQASLLLQAIFTLAVVIAVFRELGRGWK